MKITVETRVDKEMIQHYPNIDEHIKRKFESMFAKEISKIMEVEQIENDYDFHNVTFQSSLIVLTMDQFQEIGSILTHGRYLTDENKRNIRDILINEYSNKH